MTRKEHNRKYYLTHKTSIKENREKNKKHIQEYQKEYYKNNKEKLIQYYENWRLKNNNK